MNLLKIFIYKLTPFYLLIVFNLVFVSWAQAQVYAPGQGYITISAREMQISQTRALMNYLAQNLAARMVDDDLDGEPEADRAAPNDADGNNLTGIPTNRGTSSVTSTQDTGNHTRDVWGNRIRYCAWNNGTQNAAQATGWQAGSSIAGVYFALYSAGPDGEFSQTCANIWTAPGNPNTRSQSDDIHVIYTKDRLAFNATAQAFRTAVSSRNDFASLASAHRVASQNGTFENRLGADEVRLLRFAIGTSDWERRLYVRNDGRVSTANIGAEGFDPLTPMVDPYGNLIGGGSPTSNLTIRSNFNESNTGVNTGRIEFQTSSNGMASNSYITRLRIDQFGNINTMSNGISSTLVSGFSQGLAVGNKFASTGYNFIPGINLAPNASTLRSFGVLTDIASNQNAAAIFSLATVSGGTYRGWDFVSASRGQFYLQPIGVNGNYMGIASVGDLGTGGAFHFYASGTASAAVFQTNQNTSAIRLAASGSKYLDMIYDGTASKFTIRMNSEVTPIFELNGSGSGTASFNVQDLLLKNSSIRSLPTGLMLSPDRSFSSALLVGVNNVQVYKDFVISNSNGTTALTLASNGSIIFNRDNNNSLFSFSSTLTYSGNRFKLGGATLYNTIGSNLTLEGGGSFTASTLIADAVLQTPVIRNANGIEFQTGVSPLSTRLGIDQFGNINTMSNGISSTLVSGFSQGLAVGNKFASTGYNFIPGVNLRPNANTLRSFGVLTDVSSNANAAAIFSLATVNGSTYQGWDFVSASQGQFYLQPTGTNGNYMGFAPVGNVTNGGAFLFNSINTASAAVFRTNQNTSAIRLEALGNKYLDMIYDGTASKFRIGMNGGVPLLELAQESRVVSTIPSFTKLFSYYGYFFYKQNQPNCTVGLTEYVTIDSSYGVELPVYACIATPITVSERFPVFKFPDSTYLGSFASQLIYTGPSFSVNGASLTSSALTIGGASLVASGTEFTVNSRKLLHESTGSLLAGRMGLWCGDSVAASENCSVVVYGDTNAPTNAGEVMKFETDQIGSRCGNGLPGASPCVNAVGGFYQPNSLPIAFNVQGNALATAFMIPSDRRLKQSIHALRPESSYTELFRKINPVSWQWKKDGSHGIGFIAQELIGAGLGDLVKVINNPDLKEEMDANGIKSPAGKQFIVDYDGMTAFLAGAQIESIKRLDRIEKLMNAGASSELRKAIETQSILLNTQGKDLLAAMSRVEALEKSLSKVQTQSAATDARFNELGIVLDGHKKSQEKFQLEMDSLTKDVQKWEDKLKESRGKVDKFMHFFETAFDADALKDKSRLVVKVPEMKVNNLTAERIEAAAIRTQMLEAEAARIKQLEADQITAQDAKLARVYSGSKEVQSLDPIVLFELPSDGQHFVVTVSGPGVYYTATVIRVDGVTHVTPLSASPNLQNPDIQLIGDGPRLRVNAAGRAVKASWVRMG